MKRTLGIVMFMCLVGAQSAIATDGKHTGLGIIVGEPTGISFKHWLGGSSAIDAATAWSSEGNDGFHLHMDFVRHTSITGSSNGFRIPVYYGIGGRILFEEERDDRLGLRVPLGVHLYYSNVPMDFFFEIVPLMDITPDTDFGIDLALGARFYFN